MSSKSLRKMFNQTVAVFKWWHTDSEDMQRYWRQEKKIERGHGVRGVHGVEL